MMEPAKLEVRAGEELVITWPDGRVDSISATALRTACACAACRNAPQDLRTIDPETCRVTSIGLVGAYAINVVFAPDGHGTGIYPYGLLRELGSTGE